MQCYFLWEKGHTGPCRFTNISNGNVYSQTRKLDDFEVIIRYNQAIDILQKVKRLNEPTLSSMVSSRNPFGLATNVRGEKDKQIGQIKLVTSDGAYYVAPSAVIDNRELIDKWKVMISRITSEHASEPDKNGQLRIISTLSVLEPQAVCTDSYLVIGGFNNSLLADNLRSYLKSNFARFLLLLSVSSINLSKDKFQFVPVQDWSKPWSDERLYAKYGLSSDEVRYIESIIKPMPEDTLFNTDEQINPEFANFSLSEYGVKPGDVITYTPADIEVAVLEDNKVSYGGEEYTLSEFTAKNMPRNKRSISGVCQGPKYFTKGGVSLYKLKESFLGGNKK